MQVKSVSKTEMKADKLPISGLLALAMTGFICIMTETMPAGLLPQIGAGLNVSSPLAGQLVTAYALGSLTTAIPLTIITRSWRRRTVLLLTILGFLVFNSITAFSENYWLTLVARYLSGVSAGLAWALLAGYARKMVAQHRQGHALAIAMVGTPVALSLGVPLGTWLGIAIGWRLAFGVMSVLTVILIFWVLAEVPDFPGQSLNARLPLRHVFLTPGVRPVLSVVVAWMLAQNILYTYIAPFISPAGLTDQVSIILLVFGAAALAGIWITGHLVDRFLRLTLITSLFGFTLTSLAFGIGLTSPIVIYSGVAIWGLTFGGAATLLQTALADAAGDGTDVALSLNVVFWNSAIAGGGVIGGVLLETFGVRSFPPALVILLVIGLLVAWSARPHGFPTGHRLTNSDN